MRSSYGLGRPQKNVIGITSAHNSKGKQGKVNRSRLTLHINIVSYKRKIR